MKGFQFIASLTGHYRKFKGAENREIQFSIPDSPDRFRPAQIRPDGRVTRINLVKVKPRD